MGVNSVFRRFFVGRSVARFSVALVMLAIFFIASSFKGLSDRDLRAKQVNLIIRELGHRLLLQAGDSTSRVLPVTETQAGTFLLEFENEFDFDHDSLMTLTQSLLPKTQFPSGYTVTVHDCKYASIVYGFQINNTAPDILACRGRWQPAGCYTIEIVFPDLFENVAQEKTDTSPVHASKPVGVDLGEDNPEPEELKPVNVDPAEANAKLSELKSFKVHSHEANPKPEEFKTTTFGYPLNGLMYGGMLALLGVTLLIVRFGKRLVPVPAQSQAQAIIIKESVPALPALGKFLFDLKGQRLLSGNEVISLTEKECRILELLNNNFGELIPRETLMQKIWISEGVITGRSLDMFVSKLRKKLSSDPELRITNVHGKGYKLETSREH